MGKKIGMQKIRDEKNQNLVPVNKVKTQGKRGRSISVLPDRKFHKNLLPCSSYHLDVFFLSKPRQESIKSFSKPNAPHSFTRDSVRRLRTRQKICKKKIRKRDHLQESRATKGFSMIVELSSSSSWQIQHKQTESKVDSMVAPPSQSIFSVSRYLYSQVGEPGTRLLYKPQLPGPFFLKN